MGDDRVEGPEVRAVGGWRRRERVVIGVARVEPGLQLGREAHLEEVGVDRDVGERETALGDSRDRHLAVGQHEILRARLEQVRRDPEDLLLEFSRGPGHGAGEHHRQAAAAGAGGRQGAERVLVEHADRGRVDAELLGQDLRHDGLRTVPPERGAERHGELTALSDADGDPLGGGRHREARLLVPEPELGRAVDAALLAGREADPDVTPRGAEARLLLPPAVEVDHLEGEVEDAGIVAAVVVVAGRDLVGELLRPDQVLPPHVDGRHPELPRRGVDQRLEHPVVHLRAGPAVDHLLTLVGQHGLERDLHAPDGVGPRHLREVVPVRGLAELEVGAVVVDHVDPQAQEAAVRRDRQFGVVDPVRGVTVGGRQVVDPVLHELHRPPARLGQDPRDRDHLAQEVLGAEASPDRDGHDREPVRVDLEGACERHRRVVVHVGVGPHRHPLARPLVLGDGAGRLEGHGRRARPAEPAPDDPVRPGEVALDVAKGQGAAEYEVRAEVLVDERSAGPIASSAT